MLLSLSFIFIFGLMLSSLMEKLKLPGLIGMLLTGIILGPCCLNLISPKILEISPELREMALIIILLKAGLSLNLDDLKKVGRPALLLSFLPASFEIIAITFIAPHLLGISISEAAILGSVLAAVSPAVVVPHMVKLMENKYGTNKKIPQLLLAGSSMDDVYVIVLFTGFIAINKGMGFSATSLLRIPISIITGLLIGIATGYLLSIIFEYRFNKGEYIRNSLKIIIILATAFLLKDSEKIISSYIPFSGLLSVISMAMTISARSESSVSRRLSEKSGKLWLAAGVILFVLVGAAVRIDYTLKTGPAAIILILSALIFRMIAVSIAVSGTGFNKKEKLFCGFSYMPKATVQAAIGGLPLAMGLPCGETVLSVAVLSILITAPLGSILMEKSYKQLLHHDTL